MYFFGSQTYQINGFLLGVFLEERGVDTVGMLGADMREIPWEFGLFLTHKISTSMIHYPLEGQTLQLHSFLNDTKSYSPL